MCRPKSTCGGFQPVGRVQDVAKSPHQMYRQWCVCLSPVAARARLQLTRDVNQPPPPAARVIICSIYVPTTPLDRLASVSVAHRCHQMAMHLNATAVAAFQIQLSRTCVTAGCPNRPSNGGSADSARQHGHAHAVLLHKLRAKEWTQVWMRKTVICEWWARRKRGRRRQQQWQWRRAREWWSLYGQ